MLTTAKMNEKLLKCTIFFSYLCMFLLMVQNFTIFIALLFPKWNCLWGNLNATEYLKTTLFSHFALYWVVVACFMGARSPRSPSNDTRWTDLGRNNFADSDEKPSDGDCGLSCSAAVASAVAAAAALNTTLKNSLELFWPQIRQWPIGRWKG